MVSSNEFVKSIEDTVKQTHWEQEQKIQAEYDVAVAAAEKKYKSEMEQIRVNSEKEITTVRDSHRNAIQQIENELQRIETSLQGSAFAWDNSFWKNFVPIRDNDVPPFTRLGMFTAKGHYTTIQTPALLPIIGGQNLVIKASGAVKDRALEAMQSLMLRMLATLPPGKLRFVLVDPVGLGANMAGFMHLPDELTGGKAWTEANHIEQQLVDLSAHMEMVIQKYLRNRYSTMEDYNKQAGEVAEPYRLLVVANFPVNFTEQSAQRLISIASNGPRTGVYVLVVVDTAQEMPYKFNLAELERRATVIEYQENRFLWGMKVFDKCHLELDRLPSTEQFDRIVLAVGEASIAASKVEVPFERIAARQEDWWKQDTNSLLRAPIGRVGAQGVQYFELGRGTEQHALVAGRTGSGKSTLLHVLILSLAMTYSPDEMQLYLVDFKKGIEFKDYATYGLPHTRVVAIQSEREFGLSVLQGLDKELQRRGDIFREHGVTSLGEYRDKRHEDKMPRVLLLVDEFQEFFTEDDVLASQAALILDRLVRQGRAFGMHVLLASQSLSGAYSMSRSTMDQMAVRISLQCNEADSRIILGDENPAARLLSRPGEAIYNAANGLIEGNNLFQVVWLPDEEREEYLRQIQEHANRLGWTPEQPQIVFEGNAPSDVETNRQLAERLNQPSWDQKLRAIPAWLGEPVAIKPHTAALFRRQSRSNLLIIGQNEKAAMAMLSAAVVSIAAHQSPQAARFYIIDLSKADADWYDLMPTLCDTLPHTVKIGRGRDVRKILEEVGEVLSERSLLEDEAIDEAIYLVIIGIQRARELRSVDVYTPAEAAEQLSTILRDGPDLGVHTLIWCDTYNNLERVLQRQDIAEFELRVALQMSANDSNNFIDSPAANKLDSYVALFYDEERSGILEKFRPYDLPKREWIEKIGESLYKT
jgi:energy-coupling factor transporter ATP-binding protein EcfA2